MNPIARIKAAAGKAHWHYCAIYSEPAFPAGPCDCGAAKSSRGFLSSVGRLGYTRYVHLRNNAPYFAARIFRSLGIPATPEWFRKRNIRRAETRSEPDSLLLTHQEGEAQQHESCLCKKTE